jgi:diphthine synthase
MFYLIGIGLNEKGYSKEAYDAVLKSEIVYIDNYTVDFPFKIKDLEKQYGKKRTGNSYASRGKKKFILADREIVENFSILENAKKKNVALLVYGDCLTATTHISLIQEVKRTKIKFKIVHGASIFDAVAETGLQIYKFGKTTSMPKWQKNFAPESMMATVKENLSINAHTLILIDIGLEFKNAIQQLERASENQNVALKKIIVCQNLGTKNENIFYGEISKLKSKKIKKPFCIIIPGKLHFAEEEFLEKL